MKIVVVAKTELKNEYNVDSLENIAEEIAEAVQDTLASAKDLGIKVEQWDIKVKE